MNVYERLAKAQANLKAVGKGSTNKFHGYSYTSAEDMLTACRAALLDAGLVCTRDGWSVEEIAGTLYVKAAGTLQCVGGSKSDLTAVSSTFVYPVVPGNGRPIDKAISAALTTGLSYWLRDILMLPRIDGLEVDQRDDSNYQHVDPECQAIADEIRSLATAEQMEKFTKACQDRGPGILLEHLDKRTLKRWLDRVNELNQKEETK